MATIESGDFIISSNHESEAAMRAVMDVEPTEETHAADDHAEVADSGETPGAPDDAATSADHSVAPPPETQPEKRGKPRDNPQARISQAVAKQREAERKAADLEARLQALEQARQPVPPQEAPKPATPTGKPSWKAFEEQIGTTYQSWGDAQDAYADARDNWNRQAWQREQQQHAELTEKQKASTEHLARVEVAKAKYPDYQDALAAVEHIRITPVLETAILKLPNSADVVYWLATHPDELTQLASETNGLDVIAAPLVRRLLETRVGAGARPGSASTAELSKAKPPVRPVGVSSVVVPDEPGDDEPIERYIARQNAIDRKKGRL